MGRKGIKPKLLMCVVALSTMVSGILGGAPLHVKAAEEENYTVTFEAYEGTCETESISVPRGESLTLPGAVYEGHYLESWIDAVDNGNVTTFRAVGRPGDTYTPERDLAQKQKKIWGQGQKQKKDRNRGQDQKQSWKQNRKRN